MQTISIFQIDAFTDKLFHGNPAAVCILPEWFNDELLQAIALENNLSETAFIFENDRGFHIRWFTPNGEVSLCGHATLAAGFVLYELGRVYDDVLHFSSLSGSLYVSRKGEYYTLDFPALAYKPLESVGQLKSLINQPIVESYVSSLDYLVVLPSVRSIEDLQVNLQDLSLLPQRGLIATAKGESEDFYSRCFYPKHGVPEDPVTGSAHCLLTPFWAEKLGKKQLHARQGLVRQGEVLCQWVGDRVYLTGQCQWYLKGYIEL